MANNWSSKNQNFLPWILKSRFYDITASDNVEEELALLKLYCRMIMSCLQYNNLQFNNQGSNRGVIAFETKIQKLQVVSSKYPNWAENNEISVSIFHSLTTFQPLVNFPIFPERRLELQVFGLRGIRISRISGAQGAV